MIKTLSTIGQSDTKCMETSDTSGILSISFSTSGFYKFVVSDILGPLLKTSNGNQFVIVMADRYSKFICAVPVSKSTALHAELEFRDKWIMPYRIPNFLLTHKRRKLVRNLFNALCSLSGVKKLTKTRITCKRTAKSSGTTEQ